MTLKTALLVDDSKLARITLKKLLEKRNLEVTMCASAQEALDYLKGNLPDVVFMDHLMPEMDGLEALARMKANSSTQHIPVVMCTGKEEGDYEESVKQAGAIGFLAKPPESSQLENVLRMVSSQMAAAGAPAVSSAIDSDVIQVQLQALETKLMGAFQHSLSSVRAKLDERQSAQIGQPGLAEALNSRLEQLTSRTDDIGSQLTELENKVVALNSELDSLRGSLSGSDNSELLARLDALETSFGRGAAIREHELSDVMRRQLPEVFEISASDLVALRTELETVKSDMTDQTRQAADLDVSAIESRLEQKMGELVIAIDDKLAASVEQLNEKLDSAVAAATPAELPDIPSIDELQERITENADKAVERRMEAVWSRHQSQIDEIRGGIRDQVIKTLADQSAREATDYSEEQGLEVSNLVSEVSGLRQQLAESRSRSLMGLLGLGGVAALALAKAFGVF